MPYLGRWVAGFVSAVAAAYLAGAAAWCFDQAGDSTGVAGRLMVPMISRRLTAVAPARIERYQWVVKPIPDKEYRGGERVVAWPELVLAWKAADGRTHWLGVRGLPNNSASIQTYMAHFAGVFGLPWIDYRLPEPVVRRLSYDRSRPAGWGNQPPNSLSQAEENRLGFTWDTTEVAMATDRDVEQLALLWGAPAPPLTVRYDPSDPSHAYPGNLLEALSRPLTHSIDAWIVAAVGLFIGAWMLYFAFALVLRPHYNLALILCLVALPAAPLWTPHLGFLADILGVSRGLTAMFGRGLTQSVKLHQTIVEPVGQPRVNRALRWSLGPQEGAALLAQLSLPPPHLGWEELLEFHGGESATLSPKFVQRFQAEVGSALIALPDEKLLPLLSSLCDPGRATGFIYMLKPAMQRLAANPRRAAEVRDWADALANNRVDCH